MSRFSEVVVLAADAHEVMAQLTRENDGTRPWSGVFVPIESQWPGTFGRGWAAEFTHRRHWTHLLDYLQSLPWPRPETVQVLIHDEEDDCFGLWMMYDGALLEVPLPRTERYVAHDPWTGKESTETSYLCRTDVGLSLPDGPAVNRPTP
ncbi:hypothetical protein AB0F59_05005 [Micromonospora lupini]|uniref:hypothetical protein n=1 Tax=Micromonospora lupini TaxID=285679 RepID=UPI0033DA8006